MANIASPTSPPWGHLSKHVKQDKQYHGNWVGKISDLSPKMIISINRLGLCSVVSLATGQLLEHLPHCIQERMPLPLGVFATSCMKSESSELISSPLLTAVYLGDIYFTLKL